MMFSAVSASPSPRVPPSSGRAGGLNEPKRQRRVHVVVEGESLIGLALRFDVTVAQLREWNSLSFSAKIRPGQELTLWSASSSESAAPRGVQQQSLPSAEVRLPSSSSSSALALVEDQERTGCEIDLQDYIVRHFLRFREGPLERQWKRQFSPYVYYLVDQYLLEFSSYESPHLHRAYVVKDSSVSRVGSELRISIQHPESRDKRGLLILRAPQPASSSSSSAAAAGNSNSNSAAMSGEALAEAEAAKWEAALAAVAKKTVGTSVSDDTVMTFGKFFAVFPLGQSPLRGHGFLRLMIDDNNINRVVQFPLYSGISLGGAIGGPSFMVTDALKLPSTAAATLVSGEAPSWLEHAGHCFLSAAAGDRYLDDALDSVLDHYLLPQFDVHKVFGKLVANMTTFNPEDLGCVDGRQQRLNQAWSSKPAWFDETAGLSALDLLSSHTTAVLDVLVSEVLPLWVAHPETVLLAACCAAKVDYLSPIVFRKGMGSSDAQLDDSNAQSYVEHFIWSALEALLSMISSGGSAADMFRPLRPLWMRLSYLRTAAALVRRRTASLLSGPQKWPADQLGMPLNQAYCTYLLSTLTCALLKLVERFGAASQSNVIQLCRYIGFFLGFEVSRVDSVWSSSAAMMALAKATSVLPLTDGSVLGGDLGVQGVEALLRVLSKEARLSALGWNVGVVDESVVHKIIAVKLGLDFVHYRPSSALRGSRFVLYFVIFFWMLILRLLGKYKPIPLRGRGAGSSGDIAFAVASGAEEVFPGKFEVVAPEAADAEPCDAWPVLSGSVSEGLAATVRLRRRQGTRGGGEALGCSRRLNTSDPDYLHFAATK